MHFLLYITYRILVMSVSSHAVLFDFKTPLSTFPLEFCTGDVRESCTNLTEEHHHVRRRSWACIMRLDKVTCMHFCTSICDNEMQYSKQGKQIWESFEFCARLSVSAMAKNDQPLLSPSSVQARSWVMSQDVSGDGESHLKGFGVAPDMLVVS
jgi:hypothetical protein